MTDDEVATGSSRSAADARTPHRLATSTFAVLALVFLACLVLSGVFLRVGSLRPHNLLGADVYNRAFSAHGVFTLAAPPFVLLYLAPRTNRRALLWLLLGTLYLGSAVAFSVSRPVGTAILVGALALFLWQIVATIWRTPQGMALGLATVSNVVGLVGAGFGVPEAMGAYLFPVVLAVLVTDFADASRSVRFPFPLAIPVYVGARLLVRYWSAAGPLAVVTLLVGVVIGVGVLKSSRHEGSSWIRWVRRAEAVLFMEGVVGTSMLATMSETHLPDTLFAIGVTHCEAFVLLFAALRALGGSPVRRWSWSGLGAAFVGAQVFCGGAVVLGSRGMPRRYADYLPQFASLHVVVSCGAFVLCAGIGAIVVASLCRGHREFERSPEHPVPQA